MQNLLFIISRGIFCSSKQVCGAKEGNRTNRLACWLLFYRLSPFVRQREWVFFSGSAAVINRRENRQLLSTLGSFIADIITILWLADTRPKKKIQTTRCFSCRISSSEFLMMNSNKKSWNCLSLLLNLYREQEHLLGGCFNTIFLWALGSRDVATATMSARLDLWTTHLTKEI